MIYQEMGKKAVASEILMNEEIGIYYGSQTGTAFGFAYTLHEEAQEKGFNTRVIDLNDFDE